MWVYTNLFKPGQILFVIRMRFFMLHHIKMVFFGFREYFATVLGLNYIHYLKVNRARHADYLMREMLPVI